MEVTDTSPRLERCKKLCERLELESGLAYFAYTIHEFVLDEIVIAMREVGEACYDKPLREIPSSKSRPLEPESD